MAIDPATGETRWRFEMVTPASAGTLATAGGLVFTADGQGYFIALDARTGKPLWHFQTGGRVVAPPRKISSQLKSPGFSNAAASFARL